MNRKERFQQLCQHIRAQHEALIEYWDKIGEEITKLIEGIWGEGSVVGLRVGDYEDPYVISIKVRLCSADTYWENRGRPGWESLARILMEELEKSLGSFLASAVRIYGEDLIPTSQAEKVREKIKAWLSANYVSKKH